MLLPSASGVNTRIDLLDSLFLRSLALALFLEIFVAFEPAPVDLALMALLGLGFLFGRLRFLVLPSGPVVALSIFLLANLVSMLDPIDPWRAGFYAGTTTYLVLTWFLFLGLWGQYGESFTYVVMEWCMAAGIVSGLLGILGYFHLVPGYELLLINGRAKAFFKDCNVYGPFFVPVFLFALVRFNAARTHGRRCYLALVLITATAGMLLSFSRACWINIGCALAVLSLVQVWRSGSRANAIKQIKRLGSLAVLASVAVAVLLNLPAVQSMMEKRVTTNGLQSYDRVRFATQRLALASVSERPLGIGPGQSEIAFNYAAHSTYVRLATENGIIGLLSFLSFVALCLQRSIRNWIKSEDPATIQMNAIATACMVGYLANSFVIDTVHWRHIWLIFALPWASVNVGVPRAALSRPHDLFDKGHSHHSLIWGSR